jgi:hypothetical protein
VDEARIQALLTKLNTARSLDEEQAWEQLRTLGEKVVPHLEQAYPKMSKWQGRVSLVFHSTQFARSSESAFRLGLVALQDRSFMVRYRACGLLAYSLRREALSALKPLLKHPGHRTVEDAEAAISAIEEQNHHLFVDRDRTGQIFWNVQRREHAA